MKVAAGSPPQVRGKLNPATIEWAESGITPAGAGKTVGRGRRFAGAEDHPRRCGENPSCTLAGGLLKGSPPQVRGKHLVRKCGKLDRRITPAGAGKTDAAVISDFGC